MLVVIVEVYVSWIVRIQHLSIAQEMVVAYGSTNIVQRLVDQSSSAVALEGIP